MSGPEERERAVELYFTTPMTTAQVVRHLGYPTRQCRERRPAKDPRYAGRMAKPIIPLETRAKAIEPVVFCQIFVGRFGVSFSPFERLFLGRFGFGQSCGLSVIA